MSRRLEVLVLGGGCAGVAAAYALTSDASQRERVNVTVLEQSWRLGGKGATGRDPAHGYRVEEHGLHIWMGFYDHAFSMIRHCFGELGSPRLRSLSDAFEPRHHFSVADEYGRFRLCLPARPGLPGDDGPRAPITYRDVLSYANAIRGSLGSGAIALRRARSVAALIAALARGGARERWAGRSWADLDQLDLRAWLRQRGGSARAARSPLVRAFYDMAFAYPDGISGPNRGAVAAGAAVRSLLRLLFEYRGAPMWSMRHGMGDSVFAPMYDVLTRRGVSFAFGHEAKALVPGPGGGAIEAVEVRGADLRGDPLIDVGGLRCWRNQAPASSPAETKTLHRGRDFDVVILAIPVGALGGLLRPWCETHPPIARMLAASRTVATKAAQLWTTAAVPPTLGVATGAPGPFATAADLSEVLPSETWDPATGPRGLTYLVDTMPDDAAVDPHQDALAWLASTGTELLGGPAKLAAPIYARANTQGWERYVLTPPGSTSARIAPDATGVSNLRFAGDWARTSINGGSVEAAFESANIAAASVFG